MTKPLRSHTMYHVPKRRRDFRSAPILRFTSHVLGCMVILFFFLGVPLPRAHAAVNPADLDALKQLFRGEGHFAKDPATAFEKSWKPFQEPKRKGGLGGRGWQFKASWDSERGACNS